MGRLVWTSAFVLAGCASIAGLEGADPERELSTPKTTSAPNDDAGGPGGAC